MSGISRHPGLIQTRHGQPCFFASIFLLLLSGCQTATPTMSLDEAKKVTASAPVVFVPPPRTIADLRTVLEPSLLGDWWIRAARSVSNAPDPEADRTPDNKAWFLLRRGRAARRLGR